jgi:succinate dehydrogenase/fumarate reductase cytochrome b subunit
MATKEASVYRSSGLLFFAYIIVGVLVAAGVIGNDNYLNHVNTFKEVIDAILAVILWPLVLLGVHFRIGGK